MSSGRVSGETKTAREYKLLVRRQIALLSPCGFGNLGDAAIQESTIQAIRRRGSDASIIGITLNPEDTVLRHGIMAIGIRRQSGSILLGSDSLVSSGVPVNAHATRSEDTNRLWSNSIYNRVARRLGRPLLPFLQEVSHLRAAYALLGNVESLIISGGGQLDDYWGGPWAQPYAMFKWTVLARMRGVRVSFLSVGAGPVDSPLSKWFIVRALRRAQYRSYRDEFSRKFVEDMGVTNPGTVVPDLAHGIELNLIDDKLKRGLSRATIGIGPIPYMSPSAWPEKNAAAYTTYIEKLAELSSRLLNNGMDIQFFAAEFNMDHNAIQEILAKLSVSVPETMQSRISYRRVENVQEFLLLLNRIDAVVTSRFHGVLLSLVLGKPTIGLSYHRKIDDLLKDVGCQNYIVPIDDFSVQLLADKINELLAESDSVSALIAQRERQYRSALEDQFDRIL